MDPQISRRQESWVNYCRGLLNCWRGGEKKDENFLARAVKNIFRDVKAEKYLYRIYFNCAEMCVFLCVLRRLLIMCCWQVFNSASVFFKPCG